MENEFSLHTQLERNDIRVEEKLKLVESNPGIIFNTPCITFGEGRQSRVSALEIVKANMVTKVIWKRCGVEKKLTQEESESLCRHILPYRENLKAFGWNVPEVFYSESVCLTNEHVVFSYEQLIESVDVERMYKDEKTAHFERLSVLQKIIHILTNSHHQNLDKKKYGNYMLSYLPYGIDLKLANLILDAKGKLFFVDFFGPKELQKDGSWKNYLTKLDSLSEENLKVICATREGSILRMVKLALQYLPKNIEVDVYKKHFIDIISSSSLPDEEKETVLNEIENNFPLLGMVYEEYRV